MDRSELATGSPEVGWGIDSSSLKAGKKRTEHMNQNLAELELGFGVVGAAAGIPGSDSGTGGSQGLTGCCYKTSLRSLRTYFCDFGYLVEFSFLFLFLLFYCFSFGCLFVYAYYNLFFL